MNIQKQYDKIANDFASGQKEFFTKKEDQARKFISSQLPSLKGKIVLDIGCGHGVDIVTYEKKGALEVFGIDSSRSMIEEAKKIVKRKDNLFVGSMEKMPFKNNQFDIIVGRFSIHYLKNIDKAYEEFNRVLKKNGLLIIVAHHPILGFMQSGCRDYWKRKVIKMNLYKNKVKITFPYHTLTEYFSDKFFKFFTIDYLTEEDKNNLEYPNKWKVPGFLGFRAIRRA